MNLYLYELIKLNILLDSFIKIIFIMNLLEK